MKIVINDVSYDFVEAISGAALGDLLKLKVKTKSGDYLGTTVKTIQKAFTDLGNDAKADDFDALDMLGNEDFLRAMIGVIWLSRRKAGEQLEISDAERTAFSDFNIDLEDDEDAEDEVDVAGPKVLLDGEAADAPPAAAG